MPEPLFDLRALEQRRRRAERQGPRLFLAERAFEDLADRLSFIQRTFHRALLVGLPDATWADRIAKKAGTVDLVDPDRLHTIEPGAYDLVLVLGTVDTANDLPLLFAILRAALRPSGLLLGAFAGNQGLPALRAAMLAADQAGGGGVAPRVHPRIEAASLAGLLGDVGLTMPVVDVDRVRLRYRRLDDLVADLRGMGATNVLSARSRRPLGRADLDAARSAFAAEGDGEATIETVEIVHFAAWTPAEDNRP